MSLMCGANLAIKKAIRNVYMPFVSQHVGISRVSVSSMVRKQNERKMHQCLLEPNNLDLQMYHDHIPNNQIIQTKTKLDALGLYRNHDNDFNTSMISSMEAARFVNDGQYKHEVDNIAMGMIGGYQKWYLMSAGMVK